MVAKPIPVAFMAYNRGSPLISHWNVNWQVYCTWLSTSSTTRPSSPWSIQLISAFCQGFYASQPMFSNLYSFSRRKSPNKVQLQLWNMIMRWQNGWRIVNLLSFMLKLPTSPQSHDTIQFGYINFAVSLMTMPSTLWQQDAQCTFKWQHQISSATTNQRQLHRSSNSLHQCQTASCRWQLYTHHPVSKLLGSFCPTTHQNLNWQVHNLQKGTAYNAPDPPPLPKSRVQQAQPFEVTGVD